ncbi:MAG TPA: DUF4265 domain-containing protein [Puia sp.]|jgi:hypothetical protein|nr:DUF4265 domain-containing protein [Puia sp.]
MNSSRILLTYKDDDGNFNIESVWATKEGDNYRINNIPFFATNIALNDLVSVEKDGNGLYFDQIIEPSGHNTIQMIIFDKTEVMRVGNELELFGCTWEGSHINTLIAIDIPKEILYSNVKKYLDAREKNGRWSYKEACLSNEDK